MPPYYNNDIFDETDCVDFAPVSPIRSKDHCTKTNPNVQKRFRFDLSANSVHPIPHINDLSDDEIVAVWYSKQDYHDIKQRMIPYVRKMMKGEKVVETDRQSTRGLEYRSREGALRRLNNKKQASERVLDEQERQLELFGCTNDEIIAKVYQVVNRHCAVAARKLAMSDVQHAKEHCANATIEQIRLLHLKQRSTNDDDLRASGMCTRVIRQMRSRRRGVLDDLTNRFREGALPIALANHAA